MSTAIVLLQQSFIVYSNRSSTAIVHLLQQSLFFFHLHIESCSFTAIDRSIYIDVGVHLQKSDMADDSIDGAEVIILLMKMKMNFIFVLAIFLGILCATGERHYLKYILKNRMDHRMESQVDNIRRLLCEGNGAFVNQLRMDMRTFKLLCSLLRTFERLTDTKNMSVEEQVAMFLHILAHHVKNRVINFRFVRSGETVSRHFNSVLNAVLRLEKLLFKTPEPITETCIEERWRLFKNCLGALDGTYIRMKVLENEKPRYRTKKGELATNVLAVCSKDMQFIYVLPGWKGSTTNSKVLRDAVNRRHGLKVTTECFGLLKLRWAILRSPSFYPVKIHCKIITACCLIHNLIRKEMPMDPFEEKSNAIVGNEAELLGDPITTIEASNQWTEWRDNLAQEMFNEWRARMKKGSSSQVNDNEKWKSRIDEYGQGRKKTTRWMH
ncbi:hypothetical protein L1049_022309 [Liquidambar formosana]|uniref:DDE Tnp4 domain-containing protein n=1 Tax=Liquidambar formosana TaxID=63359 RepID=A0AAP0WQ22_LIQFO